MTLPHKKDWRGVYYARDYAGLQPSGPLKAYWSRVRIPIRLARWLQRRNLA